jgi:hypothetical protein
MDIKKEIPAFIWVLVTDARNEEQLKVLSNYFIYCEVHVMTSRRRLPQLSESL